MNKDNLYLDRLTELASEIIKQRGWKLIRITSLGLDYDINILGININKGTQIKIRLKNANNEYFPWFELVGTLCHELAHNNIAEHSSQFYKLMDKIHDDIEKLSRYEEIFAEMTGSYYSKGYTVIKPKIFNQNNNNKAKNTTNYIIKNGTIILSNKKFLKPKTKEGKRMLILESLKSRGLV
jgi:hypothetical protein